jgi:hypothetical protein
MDRITQSSQQTLMLCEEKARLKYIEKLDTPGSQPMTIGSAVHYGLLEKRSVAAALEYMTKHWGVGWTPSDQDSIEIDRAIVTAMVNGALERWDKWPDKIEMEFDIPLINPATGRSSTRHRFAGKIDGVFTDGPVPVLAELKTAGRIDSAYLQRLSLAWQPTAYMAAASEVFGVPVREMVYWVIKKPSIRPKKKVAREVEERPQRVIILGELRELPYTQKVARSYSPETAAEYSARVIADYLERPDFYFEKVTVRRTDADIERWYYEAWEIHQRFLRIENGGMTIRNPNQCLAFGKPCHFFDLCRGVVGPEAFTVRKDAHPELDGTTNE